MRHYAFIIYTTSRDLHQGSPNMHEIPYSRSTRDKWFSRIHPDTVSIPNRLESLEDPRDRTVIPFGVGDFLVPEATHKGADITYQYLRF